MIKRFVCLLFAVTMALAMAVPAGAYYYPWYQWNDWFDRDGAFTGTKTNRYRFDVEQSALVFAKEADNFNSRFREIYAGSDIYVPIEVELADPGTASPTQLATDKHIKNDKVEISYKVLEGADYVDAVTLVSTKKEKIDGLVQGMCAKIELADTYLPLTRSRVSVRLVIAVNGVSYQQTAVTFRCYIVNREEYIRRNSVYGALTPAQFHSVNYSGEASFDFGNKIRYTGRVAPRYKYYLNLDRTVSDALTEMYPDTYIESFNFVGDNDRFAALGKLEIPLDESKFVVKAATETTSRRSRNSAAETTKKPQPAVYVYTYYGNRIKAVSLNTVTYDRAAQTVTVMTDRLENYIFSNKPLLKTVDNNQIDILRSVYADDSADEDAEPSTAS